MLLSVALKKKVLSDCLCFLLIPFDVSINFVKVQIRE